MGKTKSQPHNIGFAAMLADEQILIFLFATSTSPGSTFNVQLFVVNFNFGFSISSSSGLDIINATQQQALYVMRHAWATSDLQPTEISFTLSNKN